MSFAVRESSKVLEEALAEGLNIVKVKNNSVKTVAEVAGEGQLGVEV